MDPPQSSANIPPVGKSTESETDPYRELHGAWDEKLFSTMEYLTKLEAKISGLGPYWLDAPITYSNYMSWAVLIPHFIWTNLRGFTELRRRLTIGRQIDAEINNRALALQTKVSKTHLRALRDWEYNEAFSTYIERSTYNIEKFGIPPHRADRLDMAVMQQHYDARHLAEMEGYKKMSWVEQMRKTENDMTEVEELLRKMDACELERKLERRDVEMSDEKLVPQCQQ
ncbi:MAG: hypothetical protein Q9169_006179 [Polycauliona sp. 2 TL-2023]